MGLPLYHNPQILQINAKQPTTYQLINSYSNNLGTAVVQIHRHPHEKFPLNNTYGRDGERLDA